MLLLLYYIIHYYIILFLPLLSSPILISSSQYFLPIIPFSSDPHFILYLSVLTYTYLSSSVLLLLFSSIPSSLPLLFYPPLFYSYIPLLLPNLLSSFPFRLGIHTLTFISQYSLPFPGHPVLFSSHSFYTCRYLHILIYILPIFQDNLLIYLLFYSSHSFYTCRYLHILIYIQ